MQSQNKGKSNLGYPHHDTTSSSSLLPFDDLLKAAIRIKFRNAADNSREARIGQFRDLVSQIFYRAEYGRERQLRQLE